MELFNEAMMTLIMYSILCFTDFIPDPNNRYQVGYVSIALISLHFTVNIAILFKNSYRAVILGFKRCLSKIRQKDAK